MNRTERCFTNESCVLENTEERADPMLHRVLQ